MIKDKKPINAGVFAVTDPKEEFFKIMPLVVVDRKDINAFAVTLEPKGGVPKPTGLCIYSELQEPSRCCKEYLQRKNKRANDLKSPALF